MAKQALSWGYKIFHTICMKLNNFINSPIKLSVVDKKIVVYLAVFLEQIIHKFANICKGLIKRNLFLQYIWKYFA